MDFKNILLLVAGILFFALATYVVYQYAMPNPGTRESVAEQLFLKSLEVGKNSQNYKYSYEENLDGYTMKTTLLKNGENKAAIIETPLARREVYYLANDTVLCVSFDKTEICSSVANDTTTKSYLKWLAGQFFSEEKTKQDKENSNLLISRGALQFTKVEKKSVGGKECENILFTIDYSNLTLDDLVKFGITQNSPTKINGEICYDETASEVYSKAFSYKYLGRKRVSEFWLVSFDWNYSKEVAVGRNLTNGSVDLLMAASERQNEFIACLDKQDPEKDKCVFTMALSEGYEQLCQYAGTKSDICKMNFAIDRKDAQRCDGISDPATKDDCYIEVAGHKKDASVCGLLANKTRISFCLDVVNKNETASAVPEPGAEAGAGKNDTGNTTANESMTDEEKKALEEIYKKLG